MGICLLIGKTKAERSPYYRSAAIIVTEAVSVDSSIYASMMLEKVLPTIFSRIQVSYALPHRKENSLFIKK